MRTLCLASGVVLLAVCGCDAALGLDEFTSASGGATSTTTTTTGGGGTGGQGGAGGLGGAGGAGASGGVGGIACQLTTELAVLNADTLLVPGCGSISYGPSEVINVGVGAGLLEFTLSSAASAALSEGRVDSLVLTLRPVPTHPDCGGGCPAAAGTVVANPLRVDWVEGDGSAYGGANWCWLTPGNPGQAWGSAGALAMGVDIWAQSGETEFAANQPTVELDLDPTLHALPFSASQLGVRLELLGGALVIGSKELPNYAAELEVRYCPH